MSTLCGIHILDDPTVSPRLRSFLSQRARRHPPTPADRFTHYTPTVDDTGFKPPTGPGIVDAMIRFEERYGGLSYSPRGGNASEYGLDGAPSAHWTSHGWAFPGILDGPGTYRLDVLADGRTAIPVPGLTHRLINSSVDQRLEADALLAGVYRWPHLVLRTATPLGVAPSVAEEHLPPRVREATGPADMWWSDDRSAFHLELYSWWTPRTTCDTWIVRCFAVDGEALGRAASVLRAAVPGLTGAHFDWCSLCRRGVDTGELCLPTVRGARPGPADGAYG
ncbi:hypothetical protein ACFVSN_01395 [Kitasatospora sp. NPDC057904]|uniref:hypothetical protein n=1 Tax=Kitasatospora sp. NPDC057904 TaxID=3346275 RepID=UPI0036DC9D3E